jgi:predicted alpha/beta hydrolase
VGFSDDPWAPPATIDLLVERFSGAQIERRAARHVRQHTQFDLEQDYKMNDEILS